MMRSRTPDIKHTARRRLLRIKQDRIVAQSIVSQQLLQQQQKQLERPFAFFIDDGDDGDDSTTSTYLPSTSTACFVPRFKDQQDVLLADPIQNSNHCLNGNHYKDVEEEIFNEKLTNTSDQEEPNPYSVAFSLPPPTHVPEPQILSDSKKTSSPRRYRLGTRLHRRIFEITLLVHLFSLFACVASSHFANLHHTQPCKNFRFPKQQTVHNVSSDQCKIWSDNLIPELCSAGTQSRVRMLRHIFLFHKLQPLSLFELFSVGWKEGGKWQLQSGEKGHDCVAGSINRCTACFRKFSATLRRLDEAYRSFDVTLSRFDCLPAVDTASATRPFSPNATCENCKLWYRRWLLVQTLQIWQRVPCINWCYYTQLACPHLAPAKLWDYAGHPSFQCRDMDIDSWRQECECIHPCDVRGVVLPGIIGNAPSVRHDFFAAQVHCETRKKECHARTTAHDRQSSSVDDRSTTSKSKTDQYSSSLSSISSASNSYFSSGFLEWKTPPLFHSILLLILWML